MRIHAADTTVPVLATGKTRTGRRVAAIYTLIETGSSTTSTRRARNAAILARLPDDLAKRIGDLFLPRNPPAQAAPAEVDPPPVVFTGCGPSCRVDRDSVHTQ